MPELHPLIWAAVGVVILVVIFELLRLLKMSGTFTLGGGISVAGLAAYATSLDLGQFIDPDQWALILLVLGAVKSYARWRTGEVFRPAPAIIGTGDGRTLGTGR